MLLFVNLSFLSGRPFGLPDKHRMKSVIKADQAFFRIVELLGIEARRGAGAKSVTVNATGCKFDPH